ncbi:hypothetical protein CRG98_009340 [Punica granatum]|uniref:Uncharacterized protein n=1 Tax=Punica granatum TaxID=22663 RepID=A0A2I0KPP0_PUNGR|nr:hypothetical protein CRG98_009340 [Punica granatum]
MWTLVGARMRAFGSRGLGVSTFLWGLVTDTGWKESPLIILRPKGAKDACSGKDGNGGARAERWGARACTLGRMARGGQESGARACVRTGVWHTSVRAGARARCCARGLAAVRSVTGVLFTREHVLHPK